MTLVIVFTIILLLMLATFITIVAVYSSAADKVYWYKTAALTLVSAVLLFLSLNIHTLIYVFLAIALLVTTRRSSKFAFKNENGFLVIGAYFGFWVSLPYAIYTFI